MPLQGATFLVVEKQGKDAGPIIEKNGGEPLHLKDMTVNGVSGHSMKGHGTRLQCELGDGLQSFA